MKTASIKFCGCHWAQTWIWWRSGYAIKECITCGATLALARDGGK
jgi:hypothetical protein